MEFVTVKEVGLRDGLQSEPELVPTKDKLELIRLLVAAGVRSMEAASFVSPKAVPQMADASEVFAGLPATDEVEYSALVLNEKGYERAVAAGAGTIAVVLSATETMNSKNANMSLAQARSVCSGIVRRTKAEGNRSQGYIAVAFSCPFEGPVSPELVCELATELFDAGVDEVIISDTIGAASPTEVFDLFSLLAKRFDLGRLSGHFHDTRALALANVWAALQVGVRKFDSSIGGLGGCPFAPGAAGNLATEDLVLMLHQCGYETGIDVDRLRSAIALAEKLVKHPLGGRVMPWLLSQQGLVGRTGT